MMSSFASPLLLAAVFALQPPGQFHGDETSARDGQHWLALRVVGADAALVATTVRVRPAFDAVLDAPGQQTGREVSSSLDEASVVAFLRGNGLRPGAIERARVSEQAQPGATTLPTYDIALRERRYRIDARCDPKPFEHVGEQAHYACRIVLDDGMHAQTLVALGGYHEAGATRMSLGDDAAPALRFAGDLDRDGLLDLVFDTTDHYNVSRPTLFLSSQATNGALVGEAARHESTGC